MGDLPIACDLTLGELRERRAGLLPGLLSRAEERCAVPGGYSWRFGSTNGLLVDIADVIEAERRCCRFLKFRLDAAPGGGEVWLEVTGPEGTRELLDTLMVI